MGFVVTERAAAALQDLLDQEDLEGGQVFRLVSNSEGHFLFTPDNRRDQDQVVRYQGKMVMVIEPSVREDLSGCILDWQQTPAGRSFTFT